MKASILERLEVLEQAANRVAIPPLRLVDVTKLDPADREACWLGDNAVMTRIGVPVDSPTGPIHPIVIDLHSASRSTLWAMI